MNFKITILFLFFFTAIENINAQLSNLQGGANDPVRDFYSDSTDSLYVVGRFTQIGLQNINHIAVWNGIDWNQFGSNEMFSSPHDLMCITKYNNEIIVGGLFDSIGNTLVNNIARWNGINWEAMGIGFDDYVAAVYTYQGELYAGGAFNYSGNKVVRALAKWNGQDWDTVGNLFGDVNSFTEYNNKLIISGQFYLQNIPGQNVIGFDGINWDNSFSKFNDFVFKVRNIDDTLYACGTFTSIPSNPSNYLSTYYDNSWHPMPIPSGGANTITDIVRYNNKKYVCGYFTNPPDIAVLNGNVYDSIFSANGFITTLYVFDEKLFFGGQFFQNINGENFYCVVSFDDFLNQINLVEKADNYFNIISNPSYSGKVIIECFNSEKLFIEIFTIDGNSLYKSSIEDQYSLHLETGIYIFKLITSNNKIYTKKIIVL